jgi:hypothetical protein
MVYGFWYSTTSIMIGVMSCIPLVVIGMINVSHYNIEIIWVISHYSQILHIPFQSPHVSLCPHMKYHYPHQKKPHFNGNSRILKWRYVKLVPYFGPYLGAISPSVWWFGTMEFYDFPFSWECHHPNWRSPSFFRGAGWNHQPVHIYIISINITIENHHFYIMEKITIFSGYIP